MSSNRSYLESLNVGRQRRPRTSIEDLNQTLDDLESRFGKPRDGVADRGPQSEGIRSRRDRRLAAGTSLERTYTGQEPHRERLAGEGERYRPYPWERSRTRFDEDGRNDDARRVAAGDLKTLRRELHQQIASDLNQEFAALRHKIDGVAAQRGPLADSQALHAELERLSETIQSVAERSDDRGIGLLRLELEQVRESLSELAREDTVRSLDQRWEKLQERASGGASDPEIRVLSDRLEQITAAVGNLPDSLSLRSLEEKVRSLAAALEHFAAQKTHPDTSLIDKLEDRLDEISRAIAASATTQPFDFAPLDRIEARISALAELLEDVASEAPGDQLLQRMETLSRRVEDIAGRVAMPERAIEHLTAQVASIAAKLDAGAGHAGSEEIVDGLERRLSEMATFIDERQGHSQAESKSLFKELDRRLEELHARIAERSATAPTTDPELLRALDEKFADLTDRIDTRASVQPQLAADLERRLTEISERLDLSSQRTSDIDSDLIRSLESQVSDLTAHLARPAKAGDDLDILSPRLDDIERSLSEQRDMIVAAAREAADNAVRSLNAAGIADEDATLLAGDLKALEGLMRKSDERNSRTFEAIHDTLLKVVDRLGTLETRQSQPTVKAKIPVASAPSIAPEDVGPALEPRLPEPALSGDFDPEIPAGSRSPAEAAAAAAKAAVSAVADEKAAPEPAKASMLGGLARALAGKKGNDKNSLPHRDKPEPSLSAAPEIDGPLDPEAVDRPLEPGSGAPNLNAIMKRVRTERAQAASSNDPGAAKADFIAAARRAAQAAAAEADSFKRGSDKGKKSRKLSAGEFLRAKRKPILMAAAAIMMALAGLQLGKAFIGGSEEIAGGDTDASLQQPLVAHAPLLDADEVAADETQTEPVRVIGEPADMTEEADEVVATQTGPDQDMAALVPDTGILEPEQAMPVEADVAAEPVLQPADAAATRLAPVPDEAGPLPLREAAQEGDPRAMFEIGNRYQQGRDTEADMAKAAQWYERSAELGLAPAQYRIGNLYEKGVGVERDLAKAKTWYQLAADQGNASAMHNLAVLFAMGGDGPRDNDSAARWFIKAAELGVKDSQFNLGILAAKGLGVPQSLEESYKWFALVAEAGDKDAATKRDEVAKALRPEQLAKARAATELWKPKPVVEDANAVDIPESWRESETVTAAVDVKQAIRAVQDILNKRGFNAGPADGIMGAKTQTAIAAYQAEQGMEPTGQINEALVRSLLDRD
ncbi:peptidoglycan-binding protein [Nitratireductor sp. CAU 1489]|uniref:Peptidoglycan-binding protein n=1 Tax=Nitratireductor arenosus TaxID=2682096 RepID=A0A844QIR7_9HYPH|nr:SEL1-like repeat protein [Nitratireductor arenosus]MVA98494.1 peptidoglycan-binding protein [Nitratireductor arenosus]